MTIKEFENTGAYREIQGQKIFYLDQGNANDTLCILHGYPTNSHDYLHLLPYLTAKFRVIVHDHPGFGLSSKPVDYDYQLKDQAAIALELWEQLGVEKGHLLAHDYGTSVATEIVALRQEGYGRINFQSLTLCNGSVHIELSQLRPIQKMLKHPLWGPIVARLSNRKTLHRNMRQLWYDDSELSDAELDLMWDLLALNGGKKVLPKITTYIDQRFKYFDRWIGGLKETDLPVHILWALNDPVAVEAIAHALKEDVPNAEMTLLDKLGHYPMIEDPERWLTSLIAFYGRFKEPTSEPN